MTKQLSIGSWKLTEVLNGTSQVEFNTPNDAYHRENVNVTKRLHVTFHAKFTGYVSRYKPRERDIHVVVRERAFGDLERLPFVWDGNKRFDFTNLEADTLVNRILSGTSWYGQDIPTTQLTIKFNHKSKNKALVAVARALKLDLWYDSIDKQVFIGRKGKEIDEQISEVIEIEADFTDDDLINDIDLLGEGSGAAQTEQNVQDIESITNLGTYWKAIGNTEWNNTGWMGDYGQLLLDDLKTVKGPIKGKISYPTYVQYQLQTGDVLPINQPTRDVSGRFRITKIVVSEKGAELTLDPKLEPGAIIETMTFTDIMKRIAEIVNQQAIGQE